MKNLLTKEEFVDFIGRETVSKMGFIITDISSDSFEVPVNESVRELIEILSESVGFEFKDPIVDLIAFNIEKDGCHGTIIATFSNIYDAEKRIHTLEDSSISLVIDNDEEEIESYGGTDIIAGLGTLAANMVLRKHNKVLEDTSVVVEAMKRKLLNR